jgi:PBP1b-binding outer membrane lipoprotein LpoB
MKTLALVALLALTLAGCARQVTSGPVGGGAPSYLNTPPAPPPSYLK